MEKERDLPPHFQMAATTRSEPSRGQEPELLQGLAHGGAGNDSLLPRQAHQQGAGAEVERLGLCRP